MPSLTRIVLWILILAGFVMAAYFMRMSSSFNLGETFLKRELLDPKLTRVPKVLPNDKKDLCGEPKQCPDEQLSFYISSGAANFVAPRICLQNQMILGRLNNNAGVGLNIAVVNGTTGDLENTGNFDMYYGEITPLIEFLKNIKLGSIMFMTTYDDASTRLNSEARELIAGFGSSTIRTLGFRDNWIFIGGKEVGSSNFEKHLQNQQMEKRFGAWPEMIELDGCIPKYVE